MSDWMSKSAFLIAMIISTVGVASSINMNVQSGSTNYGSSISVEYSDVELPGGFFGNLEACGKTKTVNINLVTDTKTYEIPGDFPCSLGTQQFTLYEGRTQEPRFRVDSGTAEITSGMSNPNKGHHIVSRFGVRTDPNKASKVRDFFLTDEPWYDDDNNPFNEFPDHDSGRPVEKGAFFLVSEADGNIGDKSDEGIYIAEYGTIIRPFGQSLSDHKFNKYTPSYGGPDAPEGWNDIDGDPDSPSQKHIGQSFNREFDNNYIQKYGSEPTFVGVPPVFGGCHVSSGDQAYEWRNDCAPLHNNGVYEPQGEIIVASEPDTSFADPSDRPLSISPKTHFYVCRNHPSDSNWQGTDPSNSKVVKVQQKTAGNLVDEWKYYHCNEANDWEEIECPPGQEVDRDTGSNKLECVNKDPVTVNVKFFDMLSVPQKTSGDSVVAGFKVNSSEVAKYENFMDQDLKRIDAECWMGDDDGDNGNLPSSSETGTFRLNYDGSGDAWVLGEIPYRTGVNNNTYSCVWGFSDKKTSLSPDDYSIYASTRHPPFRSVEGSRPSVGYSILRNQYNLLSASELDEGVSRSQLWTPYSGGDSRPYTDSTQTDMFEYPDELPYCEQPPYIPSDYPNFSDALKDVYANIMCS